MISIDLDNNEQMCLSQSQLKVLWFTTACICAATQLAHMFPGLAFNWLLAKGLGDKCLAVIEFFHRFLLRIITLVLISCNFGLEHIMVQGYVLIICKGSSLVFIFINRTTRIQYVMQKCLHNVLFFFLKWHFPCFSITFSSLPLVWYGHWWDFGQVGVLWASRYNCRGRTGGSGKPQVNPPLPHLKRCLWYDYLHMQMDIGISHWYILQFYNLWDEFCYQLQIQLLGHLSVQKKLKA